MWDSRLERPAYLARMASPAPPSHLEVFAQAWRLAEDLDDPQAQDRLVILRRHGLVLPLDGQGHVLEEVAELTQQLRPRQDRAEAGERDARLGWRT